MNDFLRDIARITLAMIVVQIASTNAATGAPLDLNWKFSQGKTLNYTTNQEMATTIRAGGQTIQLTQNQDVDMRWIVEKVNEDGSGLIRQKIDRVKLKIRTGAGPVLVVDSQDKTAPKDQGARVLWKLVRTLAKTEVSMTMSAKGVISNAQVPKAVSEALAAVELPEDMKQMFGDEGLKEMTQRSGLRLPIDPIKKGGVWNEEKVAAGVKMNKSYKYNGAADVDGRRMEEIEVSAEVELIPDPSVPANMKIVSQKMGGTVYFDADAGHLFKSTMSQEMVMKAQADGQTFEQKIRQVEVITIRTDDDSKKSDK